MTIPAAAASDAVRYFDSLLAFRQRFDRIPGVQAAVLHDVDVVLSAAYGHADVESGTALSPTHLFRIASHSKTFTATAVLQLVERKKLRLDDAVGEWLDFLADAPLADVTLRELLSHAGGVVRDGSDGDHWQLFRAFPDAAELRRISLDAADVLPRNQRFKYSNIGYSLLGLVIETASGLSYADYVTEHVVGRLGLSDTGPEYDPARTTEYATGYSALSYADRRVPIEHVDTGAMAAATGFYSTAQDVVRYAAAHFHGDDRLLTEDSKRLMQRAEWAVEGTESSYGLGFQIADVGDRRMLGHGGGYPGHITRTLFDPVDRLAVSVMTNSIDGPAQTLATIAVRLVDLAAKPAGDNAAAPPKDVDLASFRGRFASLWGTFDVTDLGGRLYALSPTLADPVAEVQELEVVDDRTLRFSKSGGFQSHGEKLTYDVADDGTVRSVRGGSGTTSYPIDAMTSAIADRDRVTVGSPLTPGG